MRERLETSLNRNEIQFDYDVPVISINIFICTRGTQNEQINIKIDGTVQQTLTYKVSEQLI